MKALSKSVVREKNRLHREEEEKALQARLDAMTDEERAEYEREQEEGKKRAIEALRNFTAMSAMFRGEYSK